MADGSVRTIVLRPPLWSVYRPRWLRLYRHARRIVAGLEPAVRCVRVHAPLTEVLDRTALEHEPPETWGGGMDTLRFRQEHPMAVELDCGTTRNHFWRYRGRRDSLASLW